MYEILLRDMGFWLPFIDLQVAVFNYFRLAPSQVHPNSIAFLRGFEIVCDYLKIGTTFPLFFYLFDLKRGTFGDKFWLGLLEAG